MKETLFIGGPFDGLREDTDPSSHWCAKRLNVHPELSFETTAVPQLTATIHQYVIWCLDPFLRIHENLKPEEAMHLLVQNYKP